MRRGWLAAVLALALAGCAAPPPPAADVVEQAARVLEVTESATYSVQIENGAAFLDPARTLNLRQAEGELMRPDRARSTARVAVGGFVVAVKFVSIGEQGYMTDPLTNRWMPAPPGLVYNAAYLFDRDQGVAAILRNMTDLAHAGEARIDNVTTLQMSGTVAAERLTVLTGGALTGERIRVDLWVARDGFALHQLRLTELTPSKRPVSWTLKISRHNEPVSIEPPIRFGRATNATTGDHDGHGALDSPMTGPTASGKTGTLPPSTAVMRLALGGALAAVFVAALDLTVIAAVLPSMVVDLGVPWNQLDRASWAVTAYLLAYTVAIPIAGYASDQVGRWPVLALALMLFAVGSVMCGQAESLAALIAGRTVQAVGGGAMVPVTMALVVDLLPPARRTLGLGVVAAVDTAGWVAGPLYGATVVALLDAWRWVFWLNLPLAGVVAGCIVVAWRHERAQGGFSAGMVQRPQAAPHTRSGGFDWPGIALLTVGLLALNLGLSLGGDLQGGSTVAEQATLDKPFAGWRWPLVLAGLLLLAVLPIVERRASQPLISLATWRSRPFVAATLVNLLVGAALIVAMVAVPVLVTSVGGDPAAARWQIAFLLGGLTAGMTVGAIGGGLLVRRWHPGWLVMAGLGLATLANLGVAQVGPAAMPATLWLPLLVLGVGFGVVLTPAAGVALAEAGLGEQGSAAGLVLVARLTGMAIGLSALTAWVLDQVDRRLADVPRPTQLPNESSLDYFARLSASLAASASEIVRIVLGDVFGIAALICLVAVVPAWWLTRPAEPSAH